MLVASTHTNPLCDIYIVYAFDSQAVYFVINKYIYLFGVRRIGFVIRFVYAVCVGGYVESAQTATTDGRNKCALNEFYSERERRILRVPFRDVAYSKAETASCYNIWW